MFQLFAILNNGTLKWLGQSKTHEEAVEALNTAANNNGRPRATQLEGYAQLYVVQTEEFLDLT